MTFFLTNRFHNPCKQEKFTIAFGGIAKLTWGWLWEMRYLRFRQSKPVNVIYFQINWFRNKQIKSTLKCLAQPYSSKKYFTTLKNLCIHLGKQNTPTQATITLNNQSIGRGNLSANSFTENSVIREQNFIPKYVNFWPKSKFYFFLSVWPPHQWEWINDFFLMCLLKLQITS